METGKFDPVTGSTDTYFNGKYVDYVYSKEEEEEITSGTGTHFFDATIIPTVQYQVYGLDNVWFWDNEGQNYTYNKANSQIEVKAATPTTVTTLSFEAYAGLTEGDTVKGVIENMTASTEVPAGAAIGDIYADKEASESDISYFKVKGTESQVYEEYSNYEFNKYGKVNNNTSVIVKITPAADLVKLYPNAIVTINGKEHDLGYLATIDASDPENITSTPKSIELVMDKDYRISINWVWGSIVETFRIICNR